MGGAQKWAFFTVGCKTTATSSPVLTFRSTSLFETSSIKNT